VRRVGGSDGWLWRPLDLKVCMYWYALSRTIQYQKKRRYLQGFLAAATETHTQIRPCALWDGVAAAAGASFKRVTRVRVRFRFPLTEKKRHGLGVLSVACIVRHYTFFFFFTLYTVYIHGRNVAGVHEISYAKISQCNLHAVIYFLPLISSL
jgi:hypothetical protein